MTMCFYIVKRIADVDGCAQPIHRLLIQVTQHACKIIFLDFFSAMFWIFFARYVLQFHFYPKNQFMYSPKKKDLKFVDKKSGQRKNRKYLWRHFIHSFELLVGFAYLVVSWLFYMLHKVHFRNYLQLKKKIERPWIKYNDTKRYVEASGWISLGLRRFS